MSKARIPLRGKKAGDSHFIILRKKKDYSSFASEKFGKEPKCENEQSLKTQGKCCSFILSYRNQIWVDFGVDFSLTQRTHELHTPPR